MNRIENCTPSMLRRIADWVEEFDRYKTAVHVELSNDVPLYAVVEPPPPPPPLRRLWLVEGKYVAWRTAEGIFTNRINSKVCELSPGHEMLVISDEPIDMRQAALVAETGAPIPPATEEELVAAGILRPR